MFRTHILKICDFPGGFSLGAHHKRKKDTHQECPFCVGEPNYCKVEYRNLTKGEYLLALRLANKLADLRAANANPYSNALRLSVFDVGTGQK